MILKKENDNMLTLSKNIDLLRELITINHAQLQKEVEESKLIDIIKFSDFNPSPSIINIIKGVYLLRFADIPQVALLLADEKFDSEKKFYIRFFGDKARRHFVYPSLLPLLDSKKIQTQPGQILPENFLRVLNDICLERGIISIITANTYLSYKRLVLVGSYDTNEAIKKGLLPRALEKYEYMFPKHSSENLDLEIYPHLHI